MSVRRMAFWSLDLITVFPISARKRLICSFRWSKGCLFLHICSCTGMESPQDSSAEERRRKSEQYEKEVQAFREESGLAREVQEEFKREALRKCNDLHKALLDCYEKKYFCGTVEKEFWDCYRKERARFTSEM